MHLIVLAACRSPKLSKPFAREHALVQQQALQSQFANCYTLPSVTFQPNSEGIKVPVRLGMGVRTVDQLVFGVCIATEASNQMSW